MDQFSMQLHMDLVSTSLQVFFQVSTKQNRILLISQQLLYLKILVLSPKVFQSQVVNHTINIYIPTILDLLIRISMAVMKIMDLLILIRILKQENHLEILILNNHQPSRLLDSFLNGMVLVLSFLLVLQEKDLLLRTAIPFSSTLLEQLLQRSSLLRLQKIQFSSPLLVQQKMNR